MGVGAVGLGVGSAFGLKTFSQAGDSDAHCKGTLCDQTGVDLRKDAHTSATISTVGFIAGGVLVAGGLVVTLTAGSSKNAPAHALWLSPAVGQAGRGLAVGGAW
jgi:hypothetical protein